MLRAVLSNPSALRADCDVGLLEDAQDRGLGEAEFVSYLPGADVALGVAGDDLLAQVVGDAASLGVGSWWSVGAGGRVRERAWGDVVYRGEDYKVQARFPLGNRA